MNTVTSHRPQHTMYQLYKTISELLGHEPLERNVNINGITWIIESENFQAFYGVSNLQEVHDHITSEAFLK